MAPRQQSFLRPLSDLTNLTISPSSMRSCSSIGSSMPQIHDDVVESQDRRKGKAAMVEYVHSTQATRKLKQINKRKPKKASQYARNPVLSPRNVEKEPSLKFISPQDYIEKQRAYFAEIDAFELVEEEVSESELE
ncbi:uncharacterized protein LOC144573583 [Carex rostrata]